jgi:hypothetical protein
VKQAPDSSSLVIIRNLGPAVMPVELQLDLANGTKTTVKLPVEIWYNGNRFVYRVPPGPAVVSARVNPDGLFPDVNPSNDAWRAPAGTTP